MKIWRKDTSAPTVWLAIYYNVKKGETNAVRITSNDKDIIEWLHSQLCIGNKIYKVGEKGFQVKYRNKESIEFMRDNGLKERKSLDMLLPNIPNEYFGDFLRGYFDGNGSVVLRYTQYNTYAQISFTSGS